MTLHQFRERVEGGGQPLLTGKAVARDYSPPLVSTRNVPPGFAVDLGVTQGGRRLARLRDCRPALCKLMLVAPGAGLVHRSSLAKPGLKLSLEIAQPVQPGASSGASAWFDWGPGMPPRADCARDAELTKTTLGQPQNYR